MCTIKLHMLLCPCPAADRHCLLLRKVGYWGTHCQWRTVAPRQPDMCPPHPVFRHTPESDLPGHRPFCHRAGERPGTLCARTYHRPLMGSGTRPGHPRHGTGKGEGGARNVHLHHPALRHTPQNSGNTQHLRRIRARGAALAAPLALNYDQPKLALRQYSSYHIRGFRKTKENKRKQEKTKENKRKHFHSHTCFFLFSFVFFCFS